MKLEFLGEEKDKLGKEIKIYYSQAVIFSSAYTFFLRHMADLIDNGHALPYTSWNDDTAEVVYAIDQENTVLGCIVFEHKKNEGNNLTIILSAIDANFRNRGIYFLLHNYVEEIAKSKGCAAMVSYVHKNNTIGYNSIDKLGKKHFYTVMVKKL